MENFKKRKPLRLKEFDYSSPNGYFITICVDKRKKVLSSVVGQGLAPAEIKLSEFGKIAEEQLLNLEKRYNNIKIINYIIMPNHIHFILQILESPAGASPCPTVSDIICAYKSLTTRQCKAYGFNDERLFQSSFYDHIIRNENDLITKMEYISSNPEKWEEDEYYKFQ